MATIHVDTTSYFNSHWKQPSGSGRWVFQLRSRGAAGYIDQQYLYTGKYAECIKQAKQTAKSIGAKWIYVLP